MEGEQRKIRGWVYAEFMRKGLETVFSFANFYDDGLEVVESGLYKAFKKCRHGEEHDSFYILKIT